ncbi:MAG: type II toxin-antitoxin system VapC family toxin [Myxococcota bacterium]
MARVTSAFFDTSILVGGLIELGTADTPAQRLMDAVAQRRLLAQTAWHCCLEFYSVATRLPEEFRLSPVDALRLVEEEVLGRFKVHQLPEKAQRAFLRSAQQERAVGGRIYDAHIAEIARVSGAKTVVTDNARHFNSLPTHGISVLTAKECLEASGVRT